MSGANASGYLESRTMKTETPSVKMVAITADEAGQRIDNFLRTQLKGVPKSMIYRILRKGEVRGGIKNASSRNTSWKPATKSAFRLFGLPSVKKKPSPRICRKCRRWPT
ncbi:Ribosomal large subunit pseudouridine synthase C [Raoultella planticola]|uniref:Ribosomal large subunit pseudouridine synthase C n=1 Tax=Raoultella planticola TaxID=575 RepID=A0A485CIJ8_RAOPL|nr:Ribosomal large subunit pseudouridine synthase C [Raoultella planticola]